MVEYWICVPVDWLPLLAITPKTVSGTYIPEYDDHHSSIAEGALSRGSPYILCISGNRMCYRKWRSNGYYFCFEYGRFWVQISCGRLAGLTGFLFLFLGPVAKFVGKPRSRPSSFFPVHSLNTGDSIFYNESCYVVKRANRKEGGREGRKERKKGREHSNMTSSSDTVLVINIY